MKKRSTKVVIGGIIAIGALFLTLAVVPAAAAATVKHARPVPRAYFNKKMTNSGGVFGKITVISGNTLTVQSRSNSSTIYTVDATNAKIVVNSRTSTLPALAVGDQIVVKGKSTGTNQISAQSIMKSMPNFNKGINNGMMHGGAVAGKITAISGSSLTVQAMQWKNASSTYVYTVDATGAKVTVNGQASTLSALAVGDRIFVRGTSGGTNQITAKIISKGSMGKGFGKGGARGFGR